MGKAIAIFNQKGGVGKTTTNINLAACLAMRGKKILVLDIDPQGNTTSGLGIAKKGLEYTSYDLFVRDGLNAANTIIHTNFKNLDIIPASVDLAGAEVELAQLEGREGRLKRVIDAVKNDYDYILVDCPPSLGFLTINSLTAVDSVLIPIQCEFLSLEGLVELHQTIKRVRETWNAELEVESILFTMCVARYKLTEQIIREVKKHFPSETFNAVIPRNIAISEAPSFGEPVIYYEKKSKGAKAYEELAKEMTKRSKKKSK